MKKKLTAKIIPKILFVIWFLFIFSYLRDVNYFSLSIIKTLPSLSLGLYRGDAILRGNKITIEYFSKYKKLGTIGVKFTTYNRINTDILRFRIKKAGQVGWYYEHDYKVDQFQPNQFFPFGFPVIDESAGNAYWIEVESLNGIRDDSVAIKSPLQQSVVAKHVFTRSQLLSSPRLLIYLGFHKVVYFLSDPEFLIHLFLYSLPLLFYLIYALVGSSMGAFSVVIFLSVLLDIIYIKGYSAFLILSIIFGWWLMVWHHKVEGRVSSSVFFAVFSLSPILYLTGQAGLGDKAAVWAYMFLAFSMSQSIFEIKAKSRNLILIKDYWHDLVVEGRNMGLFITLIIIGEIKIAAERIRLSVDITKSDTVNLIHQAQQGINKTKVESGDRAFDTIALVVYRWETPMVKTYIYTSRFLAYIIIFLVRTAGAMVYYGPYAVFGWLVWSTINQVRGYLNFFQEFFVQNQNDHFWNQIGNSILAIYLVILIIFLLLLFQRRLDLKRKTLVGVVILYLCTIIIQTVFNRSTPYRDDLKIWSVGPHETAEPWVDVTITGRNFGEMPFVGKVYIDGIEQRIMKWSKKEIIFRTNPLSTRTGNLAVKAYSKAVSNTVKFTYTGNR